MMSADGSAIDTSLLAMLIIVKIVGGVNDALLPHGNFLLI